MEASPKIFLSYAREDEERVKELYQELDNANFKPWMDQKNIFGGEDWLLSIEKAIGECDFFIACLSNRSISKRGVLQKEIKKALDILKEKLDSDIYFIPVRLEDCRVPEQMMVRQWIDLFKADGWEKLIQSIKKGMQGRQEKFAFLDVDDVPLIAPIKQPTIKIESKYESQPRKYKYISIIVALTLIIIFVSFLFLRTKRPTLSIETRPDRAVVYINNDSIGVTPIANWPVPNKEINLHIEKSGYWARDTTLPIQINQFLPRSQAFFFSFELNKDETGGLQIFSIPDSAEVILDGKKVGTTPYEDFKYRVGRYDLTLRKNGYNQSSRPVTVKYQQNTPLRISLIPLTPLAIQHKILDRDEWPDIKEYERLVFDKNKVDFAFIECFEDSIDQNLIKAKQGSIEAKFELKDPSKASEIVIYANLSLLPDTTTEWEGFYMAVPNGKVIKIPLEIPIGNYLFYSGFFYKDKSTDENAALPILRCKKCQVSILK